MPINPDQAQDLLKYGGSLGVVVLMILLCSAFVFRMLDSLKLLISAMNTRFDRLEDRFDRSVADIEALIRDDKQNRPTLPNTERHH